MLVCPNCREENLEEAAFCRVCGRSLEPVGSYMRRVERRDEDDVLEMPARRGPRPWVAAAATLALVLGAAGWGAFALSQPDPCRGLRSSTLFPYCTRVPRGWNAAIAADGSEPIDRYSSGMGASEAVALADVRVEDVVDPTVQTTSYAQQFRISQEADGLDPTVPEGVMLDGEQGVAWNYTIEPAQPNEEPLHLREVILVRPEGAWRITLVAEDPVYLDARVAFERLLQGWRWRS